jgi:regulator of replication initiation timing
MEKLNDLKGNLHTGFGIKCYGLHQCDIDNLFDTIEALQQEIVELRAELEITKHIATTQTEAAIDLQPEIEQLQAQNGLMLKVINPLIKLAVLVGNEKHKKGEHQGAIVAEMYVTNARNVIAAIDKAGGGEK